MTTVVNIVELTIDHAPMTFRFISEPIVAENLGLRSVPSLEKTIDWITRASADQHIWAFAIVSDGSHIGNIVFDTFDPYLKTIRLSMYIGESQRGQGKGTLALKIALNVLLNSTPIRKVWLTVHEQNFGAIDAYTRAGFQIEGLLRDEFLLKGKYVGCIRMAFLKDGADQLA